MSLPTLFAVTAVLLAHRRIAHPLLYFALAVFTFCWIAGAAENIAYKYFVPSPPHDMDSLMRGTTLASFVGDAFAAFIGGFIVWRLAIALRVR
jgi:hypothetical protein